MEDNEPVSLDVTPIPYTRSVHQDLAAGSQAHVTVKMNSSPAVYAMFIRAVGNIISDFCERENTFDLEHIDKKLACVLLAPMIHPASDDKDVTGCLFVVYRRGDEDPEDCTKIGEVFLELDDTKKFVSVISDVRENFPLKVVK